MKNVNSNVKDFLCNMYFVFFQNNHMYTGKKARATVGLLTCKSEKYWELLAHQLLACEPSEAMLYYCYNFFCSLFWTQVD